MTDLAGPELLLVCVAALAGVGLIAFWIWMLVDCLKNERFSGQDRLVWVIVIVALKVIGAFVYYFMEYRRRSGQPAGVGHGVSGGA